MTGERARGAFDVIVVGAGIVGAACAEALSREGLSVVVLDASDPGQGATAACMGHLAVMDDSEPQFALTRYSCELWQALSSDLPGGAEWDPCGTLWIAASETELAVAESKARSYASRGVRASLVDAKELGRLEPELRPGLAGALRLPDDASVYPPVVTSFLLERARRRGADVRAGAEVRAISGRGVALTNGEELSSGAVVDAAGVRALELLEGPRPRVAVRPRKGHLAITDRYPGRIRHELVELGYLASAHALEEDSVAFNLQPRATGQLLVGSSRQFSGTPGIETATLTRMIERALEFVPGLGNARVIRSWVGFRPASTDKLPLIGRLNELPNVLLATGHEGLGITTCLGTAELIADAVIGRASKIDPRPYLPNRGAEDRDVRHEARA